MPLLVSIAMGMLGAVMASFIGVIVARLNTGQSFLTGHSRCDACNAPLPPFSLVPAISFLVLEGRAHCCGSSLSPLAPLGELLLGGLFIAAYWTIGLTPVLPLMLCALSVLSALVLYDLRHQILPPALLGAFFILSALVRFALSFSVTDFSFSVFVAFLLSLPFILIHLFSRGRLMGFSDAPLVFALALLVGSAAFPGLVFSFWIGAVVGIFILAWRPKGSILGTEVPFAPYLAAGFLLAYFTQWNPFASIAALL